MSALSCIRIALYSALAVAAVVAQPGRITLVAGGVPLGEGRPATEAHFYGIQDIAIHPQGGLVILTDWRLVRVDAAGVATRIAGSLIFGYSRDGEPALSSQLGVFQSQGTCAFGVYGGIAVDAQGVIYVAETGNARIRKIGPEGVLQTVAGNGISLATGDGGPATSAQIQRPADIALGRDGTLYVTDPDNHRIRKIDPNGTITTFAGDGNPPSANGTGGAADAKRLNCPYHLAVDAKGNVFVSDPFAHVVRQIAPDGAIRVVAGTGRAGFSGDDGPALLAQLNSPGPLTVDEDGTLYIADNGNGRIRVLSSDGVLKSVGLSRASALAVSAGRTIFAARDHEVVTVDPAGEINPYAGADRLAGIDGPAAFARVWENSNVRVDVVGDATGTIYLADGSYIRKVDPSGRMTLFAGKPGGIAIQGQPVPALEAQLDGCRRIDLDPKGRVLLLCRDQLLRIDSDGLISLIAGGPSGFAGDGGLAAEARFNNATDFAVDRDGVIYVADEFNYRIRRIGLDGMVSTIAGTGANAFSGDNGLATATPLKPFTIAVDKSGDILFAEYGVHRVRRISNLTGRVSTAIGDGSCGYDPPRNKICLPRSIATGPSGEIYAGLYDGSLMRATPSGTRELLTPAGWRMVTNGNTPVTRAFQGISVTPAGDLLFSADYKLWKAQGNGPYVATPSGLLFAFSLGAPAASQAIALETGDNNIKPYEISSSAPWLTVSPATGKLEPGIATNLRVTADPKGLTKGSYTAKLTVRNPEDQAQRLEITVSITVSGTPQQMRLSQTGFAFAAVPNGAVTSPRALQVLNTGIGSMPWRATTTTLAGGSWLQVSPDTGTSEAGRAAPEVRITANPAGLAPGVYFGLVSVGATGVDNAPQSATIILNVTAQNQPPGAIIEPAGLLFATGLLDPAPAQQAQLANLTTGEVTYSLALAFPRDSPTWASITAPTSGRVAAGATARLEVKPNIQGLKPGVYAADLRVTVGSERTPRIVNLVLVLANSSVSSKNRAAEGCAGTKLVPVFASPIAASQSPTGWPTSVSVKIVDDCAQPLTEGRVSVSFSNGDPSLALVSEGNGRWSGTWAARNANARVTLTATARSATSPPMDGTGKLDVGVRADTIRPLIAPGGVRSLASQLEGRPVAMGSPVLILGSQLVPEADKAAVSPLPTEIKGTSALIAGKFLRLSSVAADRLEAVLPSGIADSTPLQVIVKRGTTYSVPETVIVAQAQPEIFTAGGTGVGQGMVYTFEESGRRWLADSERPLKPGDRVFILCAGLGPVDRPLADGAPAPDSGPPQVVNPVAVTIQNQSAEQVTAYLAPGMVGMYWVTATVPSGLKPDVTADVVVKVGDGASPPVTAAVRPPVEP